MRGSGEGQALPEGFGLGDGIGALNELQTVLGDQRVESQFGFFFEAADGRGAVDHDTNAGQNFGSLVAKVVDDREDRFINTVAFGLASDVDQIVFFELAEEIGVFTTLVVAAVVDFWLHDGVVFGLGDIALDFEDRLATA